MGWEKGGSGASSAGALSLIQRIGPLSSPQASFDFTALPASSAFVILGEVKSDALAVTDGMYVRLNGDAGAHYNLEALQGSDATASANASLSNTGVFATIPAASSNASAAGVQILVPNASSTFTQKTILIDVGYQITTPAHVIWKYGGYWIPAAPAAVTQITVFGNGHNFIVGSVLSCFAYSLA